MERGAQLEIGKDGQRVDLLIASNGKKLFLACDVPSETTPGDFDQLRFYYHLKISPIIVHERVHVDERFCMVLRETTIKWSGPPPSTENEEWKKFPVCDWDVCKHVEGKTTCRGHRQYEVSLDLKECGLHEGIDRSPLLSKSRGGQLGMAAGSLFATYIWDNSHRTLSIGLSSGMLSLGVLHVQAQQNRR